MKNQIKQSQETIIIEAFKKYHSSLLYYITYKISNNCDAEDLSQDVFLRLMDYQEMLRPETIRSFLYTIARNLVIDYLRRQYKKQEITSYMYETCSAYYETEKGIVARDLENHERMKVCTLPEKRRRVYLLSRYEEKTVDEIADELNINHRTVENHLRISRHEVREYIKECI